VSAATTSTSASLSLAVMRIIVPSRLMTEACASAVEFL
jgi:hypothetical protein